MKLFQKKSLVMMLILVCVFTLMACNSSQQSSQDTGSQGAEAPKQDSQKPSEEKTYSWKIGFNTYEGSVRDVAAQHFKKVVEERTNGRVQIEIFPGEALGSEQEMVEAVQFGALDMQLAGMGGMSNIIPEYSTTALPFMVGSFDEAYALLDGPIGDMWKEAAEENGFKVLAHTDLGFAQITNNVRPINSPEDLQGIKMRSPNEPTSIATFRTLGASVSTMPFTEVYLGLSQGVVEGQFNPLDAIYDTKFHEVQDYLAITNHFYYFVNFIMNKDLWNSLDPELQAIVQDAANEARDVSREFTQRKHNEMIDVLKDEFVEITHPDLEAFRVAVTPAFAEFEQIIPKEKIEAAQKFLEEYRANK